MSTANRVRRMMRAAVMPSFKAPFQIVQAEVPTPQAHEVLVRIKASGCCHTDVHAVEGDW